MIPQQLKNLSNDSNAVLNMFHEWKSVNHDFEEIRILLKHQLANPKVDENSRKLIEDILKDSQVMGRELNMSNNVNLGDQHVGIYISNNQIRPYDVPVNVNERSFSDTRPFILPFLFKSFGDNVCVLVLADHCLQAFRTQNKELNEITGLTDYNNFQDYLRNTAISKKVSDNEEYKDFNVNKIGLSKESLNDKRNKIAKDLATKIRPIIEKDNLELFVVTSSHFSDYAHKHFKDLSSNSKLHIVDLELTEKDLRQPQKLMQSLFDHIGDHEHKKEFAFNMSTNDPCVIESLAREHKIDALKVNESFLRHHLASMEKLEELKVFNRFILKLYQYDIPIGVQSDIKDIFLIQSDRKTDMSKDRYYEPKDEELTACENLWRDYLNHDLRGQHKH